MASIIEYFPRNGGTSKFLYFDIVKSEKHEASVEITEHPVERGVDVADHYRRKLEKVTLEVYVSNSPIGTIWRPGSKVSYDLPTPTNPQRDVFNFPIGVKEWNNPLPLVGFESQVPMQFDIGLAPSRVREAKVEVLSFDPFDGPAETLETLSKIRDEVMLCNVLTPKRNYLNMLLEAYPMSRDPEDGDGASFSISFREVRVIETKIVTAPKASMLRGSGGVAKGKQAGTEAKKESAASIARNLIGNIFGGQKAKLGL